MIYDVFEILARGWSNYFNGFEWATSKGVQINLWADVHKSYELTRLEHSSTKLFTMIPLFNFAYMWHLADELFACARIKWFNGVDVIEERLQRVA